MSEGPIIGDWTQYEWIPDNASSFPARIRLRDTAWMVYYEPDVTGLKAEVLLLRQENKELRADQAHWELGNCPSCPNVVSLQEALEQNVKLRELCKTLYQLADESYVPFGSVNRWTADFTKAICAMQELGIEVD